MLPGVDSMIRSGRRPRFENIGELLESLGGIPADRVRLDPMPGHATKRDLLRYHERGRKLYELVDRTLVEKPMGSPGSFLAIELGYILRDYLEQQNLGYLYGPDALIEILPNLVRGPDISFTPWQRRSEQTVPGEPIADRVPELVVEVLSPRNTHGEIVRKLDEYFLGGVRLAWVIDPRKRSADVYTAPDQKTTIDESGELDGADVRPGLRIPLARLFARLEKPKPKKKKK
jgi:Uma2 family endonuclease